MQSRLRQIVLVAEDLGRVEEDFANLLGLETCFRDPIVAKWNLRNAILPVGNDFIEVVSPSAPDTAAGRHLARNGGDGGYMLMLQVPDRDRQTERVVEHGFRVVYKSDQPTYCLSQFHPADCGGLIVAFEQVLQEPEHWKEPDSFWHAAGGYAWRDYVRTDRVGAVLSVTLASRAPDQLAARYGVLLEPEPRRGEEGALQFATGGPAIRFERGDSDRALLSRIDLEGVDGEAARASASARGRLTSDGDILICGVAFRLA